MLIAKIAFRNLFRHKRRTLFTGLTICGGFVLSLLSLGIAEGSYDKIIKTFIESSTGAVQIHKKGYLENPSIYETIDNLEKLNSIVSNSKNVKSSAPRVYFPALVFLKDKTNITQIMAIDPKQERETTTIEKKLTKGRFLDDIAKNEIMITAQVAKLIKADVNSKVSLVSQSYDGSVANDNFEVTAILGEDKLMSYMHIKTAQDFFYMPRKIHELAITLANNEKAKKTANEINLKLTDTSLKAEPWQVVEKDFYKAMQADKKGNHISLIIIMLIVAIGVLNTILMSVLERTREFGILKAVGTKPSQIAALIILETCFLTVISIAMGFILALVLNWYFVEYGIKMSEQMHYGGMVFDKIISTWKAKIFIIPALVTFATALLAGIFPAIKAARTIPAKAMREF